MRYEIRQRQGHLHSGRRARDLLEKRESKRVCVSRDITFLCPQASVLSVAGRCWWGFVGLGIAVRL